ncbi:MAG: CAAX prenyl protease-related protein [Planctomycetota bacterium]
MSDVSPGPTAPADALEPPLPYQPPPTDGLQRTLDGRLGDGWWLVLPMAVFLILLAFVPQVTSWLGLGDFAGYVAAYVARTLIVGAILIWLWRRLMAEVEWTHLGTATIFGLVGTVQWIGCDKLLLAAQETVAPDPESAWRLPFWILGTVDPEDGYNLFEQIESPLWLVLFIVVRLLGPVLVVPVMEELFWRDWLWRGIIAPSNYRLAKVGEWDATAFIVTSLAFSVVHPQRLVAVIWGLLVAWLLVKTRSLGAIIWMHAVTNLLLGIWVLSAEPLFGLENEWYFW